MSPCSCSCRTRPSHLQRRSVPRRAPWRQRSRRTRTGFARGTLWPFAPPSKTEFRLLILCRSYFKSSEGGGFFPSHVRPRDGRCQAPARRFFPSQGSPGHVQGLTPAMARRTDRSDLDALFLQGELGEAVPVGLDLFRHGLLVGPVLPRGLGRFLVVRLLRNPLEQLVARDLQMLGRVTVPRVAAGLLLSRQVDDALHQCSDDSTRLPDHRRRGAVSLE